MKHVLAAACFALALGFEASAADRSALLAESMRLGFDKAEEALLAASASGDAAALKTLTEFYVAHQLWPEALAAIARVRTPDAETEILAAEAQYSLGRCRKLAGAVPRENVARAFRAMSLVRLGAYSESLAAFASASTPDRFAADYDLSKAEALIASGDAAGAAAALTRAAKAQESGESITRSQFLRAVLLRIQGEEAKARAEFRRAGDAPPDEWSMRARIAETEDESALAALSLAWKSEAFDRELLMRRAALSAKAGDYEKALRAFAAVTTRFPESDAALKAQAEGGGVLAALFKDADLSAEEAARIFFEHVAFAPPGREGDALIRSAAARLKTLGLYAEAAALIDHQVFKRLRGADRSRVAAELADLHLAARAPEAALAALRATRISGLDADTNARRRRLEATALAELDKDEAALTLLAAATEPEDRRLRAAIAWEGGNWPQSAADYAAAFSVAPEALSKTDRETAVRAATAYLLAGDRSGYRAFVEAAAPRLKGAREESLIRSLGDVDRDAFLQRFMEYYRALYGAPADS
jgi:hypothetical protein